MFNKVAIIGIGLLGGSLAKDIRSRELAKQIVGVCKSNDTGKFALAHNVVDEIQTLEVAVCDADLIVLATPMQTILPIVESMSNAVSANAIITDVGSVKKQLYDDVKSCCENIMDRFVFAHPIAGGENSGVSASKNNLFKGKNVIITQTDEVSDDCVETISKLWTSLGANVVSMSLQEHDSIFAKTSHLPHAIAFSLVNFLANQANREQLFELAAAGFYDFTRIASSNAEMWRDICITNQAEVLNAIDGYTEQLLLLRSLINDADQQQILEYFSSAKESRDFGVTKKEITSNTDT